MLPGGRVKRPAELAEVAAPSRRLRRARVIGARPSGAPSRLAPRAGCGAPGGHVRGTRFALT